MIDGVGIHTLALFGLLSVVSTPGLAKDFQFEPPLNTLESKTGLRLNPTALPVSGGERPRPDWENHVPSWVPLGVAICLTAILIVTEAGVSQPAWPPDSGPPH